jgi:hypothetical protein
MSSILAIIRTRSVMYLFKTSMNVPVTLVNMTEHVGIVSTVMYVSIKKYTEMWEEWTNDFWLQLDKLGELGRVQLHLPVLFLKSTKKVFNVEGAWHSANMLPTKGVTRSCKSKKDRQHNGQMKKDKHLSTKHYTEKDRLSIMNLTTISI